MAINPLSGIESLYPEWKEPTAEEFGLFREQLGKYPGLAPTDYDKQIRESEKLGKLQFALSLMARGFGGMGATPRVGEMPISTFGREVAAPIAADVAPIAQRLYDQRLQYKLAEKQQEANLTLATLGRIDAAQKFNLTKDIAMADKVMDYKIALAKAGQLELGETIYMLMKGGEPVLRNKEDPNSFMQMRIGDDLGNIYDIGGKADYSLKPGETLQKVDEFVKRAGVGLNDPKFVAFYQGVLESYSRNARGLEHGRTLRGLVYNPSAPPGGFPFMEYTGKLLTEEQQRIAENKFIKIASEEYFGTTAPEDVGRDKAVETTLKWMDTILEDFRFPQVVPPDEKAAVTPTPTSDIDYSVLENIGNDVDLTTVVETLSWPATNAQFANPNSLLAWAVKSKPGIFGPATQSNAISTLSEEDALSFDLRPAQDRTLYEAALADSKLNIDVAANRTQASRYSQLTDLIDERQNRLNKISDTPADREVADVTNRLISYENDIADLEQLVNEEALIQGVIKGPAFSFTGKYFEWVNNLFQGEEGKDIQQKFTIIISEMNELLARDLVRTLESSGRLSDKDLQGMRKILVSVGKTASYTEKQIKRLKVHLRNAIEHSLRQNVGAAPFPEELFRAAVSHGIDLSKMVPKNDYYTPFMPQPYAASGQMQPGYSEQQLGLMRNQHLLNQSLKKGSYRLPIFDDNEKFVRWTDVLDPSPEQIEMMLDQMQKLRTTP
jgi:hypothetical protein